MVHTHRADMNSILLLLCFEFHRFKIILRKILNVEIREDTHSTHDTGQKIFEAPIRYFWKRCIQRKISCRAVRAFHWSWLQCNWKPAFHAFLHNCLWRGGVGWQILLEHLPLTLLTFLFWFCSQSDAFQLFANHKSESWMQWKDCANFFTETIAHYSPKATESNVHAMQSFLPPARKRGWEGVEIKTENWNEKNRDYVIVATNWIGNVKVWSKDKEPTWKLVEKGGGVLRLGLEWEGGAFQWTN